MPAGRSANTVTFVDHDGTVLKEEIVNYNSGATAPADRKESATHLLAGIEALTI